MRRPVNLDEELRRLFADERLALPVRPDADQAVVAGARKVRRRQLNSALSIGALTMATVFIGGTAFGGDAPEQQRVPLAAPATIILSSGTSSVTSTEPTTTTVPSTSESQWTPQTTTSRTTTTAPTTTTRIPPPSTPLAFGPESAGQLRLGMSEQDAVATGMITANVEPISSKGCKGYDIAGFPKAARYYAVLFSAKYGLVKVGGIANAVTPEGIYIGSTEAEMKKAYPTQAPPHGAVGEYVTPVPGNPKAQYWIIVANHVVIDIRLELTVQDCY